MQKFSIGDKVQLLNGHLKGVINSLTNFKAIVIDDDGFEDEYLLGHLVKISEREDYEPSFKTIPLNKEIKKTIQSSKSNISKKVKEIDLHMDTLSESKRGMTNHEIVIYQLNAVNKALRVTDKRYFSKIVFIHGVGEGKLKKELELFLKQKHIYFQDASYRKYGRGAIEILL